MAFCSGVSLGVEMNSWLSRLIILLAGFMVESEICFDFLDFLDTETGTDEEDIVGDEKFVLLEMKSFLSKRKSEFA